MNTNIAVTEKDFAYWRSRPFLTQQTRDALANASVVVVPAEGFREQDIRVFPVGTEELLAVLREQLPADLPVDIAIDDSDYKELALHSELLVIGSIVAGSLIVPVVVNVVSEYINRRLYGRKDEKDTKVRWELTVVEGDRASKISYEGPAIDFRDEMQKAIAGLAQQELPAIPPKLIDDGTATDVDH